MAKSGGGAGRGGGGGGSGSDITFSRDYMGSIYGQSAGDRGRSILLAQPTGIVGGTHSQAAQSFLDRTAAKLGKARSEAAVATILDRADRALQDISTSSRFLEPVPKLPW